MMYGWAQGARLLAVHNVHIGCKLIPVKLDHFSINPPLTDDLLELLATDGQCELCLNWCWTRVVYCWGLGRICLMNLPTCHNQA